MWSMDKHTTSNHLHQQYYKYISNFNNELKQTVKEGIWTLHQQCCKLEWLPLHHIAKLITSWHFLDKYVCAFWRKDGQADGQTDGQTNGQTDGKTGRQRDRQMDRDDRQADGQTDRQTYIHVHTDGGSTPWPFKVLLTKGTAASPFTPHGIKYSKL